VQTLGTFAYGVKQFPQDEYFWLTTAAAAFWGYAVKQL
jgi:hypothetical protein